MMVTGVIFTSFLFLYLGIKVTKSIDIESSDVGPVEISFLLSFSGIRYMSNHVRHHLFETPLTPRRRFSSLSTSWLPQFLKRTSLSFRSTDILLEEGGSTVIEKGRRNSSFQLDSQTSRRSSTSSKSKRLSVPNVQTNRTPSSSGINTKENVRPDKEIIPVKHLSRRNTLPNIPVPTVNSDYMSNVGTNEDAPVSPPLPILENKSQSENISLSVISEEEITEVPEKVNLIESTFSYEDDSRMPVIEEEEDIVDEVEYCESEFSEIISEISSSASDNEDASNEESSPNIATESKSLPINVEPQSSISPETASPKPSSFRSSYFNYLPEYIFGYSTGITKNITTSSSIATEINEAPPGFSKRSASHDYSNATSTDHFTDTTNDFNYHQPLYARRRTETSKGLSEAAKPFIPLNFVPAFKSFQSKSEEASMSPNRSNASSPCLIELQNTDDLFAPINWGFSNSDQTEELRKSWDSVNANENYSEASLNSNSRISETDTKKRNPFSSFSSIFDGY